MTNPDCPFCNSEKIEDRVLYQTKNFRVIVGINIIAPGHIMIVSNNHIPALTSMPEEIYDEFFDLVKKVKTEVTEKFSEPFMIEYGNWGQSVFHAHIHIVPKKCNQIGRSYEVENIMKEMIEPVCEDGGINYEKNISWDKAVEVFKEINGYVLVIDNDKINIVKTGDDLDQDSLMYGMSHRGFFQNVKGIERLRGWKNMSEADKVRDTKNVRETKDKLVF